jgi:hypothetical protein
MRREDQELGLRVLSWAVVFLSVLSAFAGLVWGVVIGRLLPR